LEMCIILIFFIICGRVRILGEKIVQFNFEGQIYIY
jgi:hypothetical protein